MKRRMIQKMEQRPEWEARVYNGRQVEEYKRDRAWTRFLRSAILKRDRRKCVRCGRDERYGDNGSTQPYVHLSVHHIISRDEHGTDDYDNLVTLCNFCHDFVESQEPPLRTLSDIEASNIGELLPTLAANDSNGSDDWRIWVYGGAKNPKL